MKKLSKKKKNILVIVLCVIFGLLIYVVPTILFIIGINYIDDSNEFTIQENQIIVENNDAIIKDVSSFYDIENDRYVVTGSILNNNYESYIDISYNLYDSEGYIIGEAYSSIMVSENSKYKFYAIYEGYDASNVVSYKLKEILAY